MMTRSRSAAQSKRREQCTQTLLAILTAAIVALFVAVIVNTATKINTESSYECTPGCSEQHPAAIGCEEPVCVLTADGPRCVYVAGTCASSLTPDATIAPTAAPTLAPSTASPSSSPTVAPSSAPSASPTPAPTGAASQASIYGVKFTNQNVSTFSSMSAAPDVMLFEPTTLAFGSARDEGGAATASFAPPIVFPYYSYGTLILRDPGDVVLRVEHSANFAGISLSSSGVFEFSIALGNVDSGIAVGSYTSTAARGDSSRIYVSDGRVIPVRRTEIFADGGLKRARFRGNNDFGAISGDAHLSFVTEQPVVLA